MLSIPCLYHPQKCVNVLSPRKAIFRDGLSWELIQAKWSHTDGKLDSVCVKSGLSSSPLTTCAQPLRGRRRLAKYKSTSESSAGAQLVWWQYFHHEAKAMSGVQGPGRLLLQHTRLSSTHSLLVSKRENQSYKLDHLSLSQSPLNLLYCFVLMLLFLFGQAQTPLQRRKKWKGTTITEALMFLDREKSCEIIHK